MLFTAGCAKADSRAPQLYFKAKGDAALDFSPRGYYTIYITKDAPQAVVHAAERRNMTEKIRIKRLSENAKLPTYGTPLAAGADLYACIDGDSVKIDAGETVLIHCGIALELPVGYVGLIFARSGIATRRGLAPANKVGVIDPDYRGELMVALHNHSGDTATVENGERIAQLVIVPYLTADFVESDSLDDTLRGEGGFGSTGKN